MKIPARAFATLMSFAVLLAACGGGGGGGGGGGPAASFGVSYDKSSISITALRSSTPSASGVIINAVGSGPAPDALYIGATVTGTGILTPLSVIVNPATQTATITVLPNTSLAVGVYSGTITLLACRDSTCSSHFQGSPRSIPYTVTIEPRLAVQFSSLSTSAPETALATPIPVTVTLPNGVTTSTVSVTYVQGSNWLQVANAGTTVTITPDARALLAGTYQATVNFQTTNPAQSTSMGMTFVVTPGMAQPPNATVLLNGGTLPAATSGSFQVDGSAGAALPTWTADSDVPWLVLDQNSGSAGQSVQWHIDLSAVAAIERASVQEAQVTVSAGTFVTPRVVTIQLSKQLPEIASVDRLALQPGVPGSLMIYGSGFDTIASVGAALQLAGIAPTSVSILSDRAILVNVPALSAGSYTATLVNPLGVTTPTKSISVLAPVDRTYQTVDLVGTKGSIVWDALTQNAFVVNEAPDAIARIDLSGPIPALYARNLSGLHNIGISRDRSTLLAIDDGGTLHDLRTTDMSTIRTRTHGPLEILKPYFTVPIAVTGDNLAWIPTRNGLPAYDLERSRAVIPVGASTEISALYALSPDGRRMIVNQSMYYSPAPPMLQWDTTEGSFHQLPQNTPAVDPSRVTSNREGTKWAIGWSREVQDFDLNVLGNYELDSGWTPIRTVMSRSGDRLYAYALHANAVGSGFEPTPIVHWPRFYVIDTSTPPATPTSNYPVMGYIELSDYPTCRSYDWPIDCSAYRVTAAITDDDRTLFVAGDRKFIVVPIPPAYQSP